MTVSTGEALLGVCTFSTPSVLWFWLVRVRQHQQQGLEQPGQHSTIWKLERTMYSIMSRAVSHFVHAVAKALPLKPSPAQWPMPWMRTWFIPMLRPAQVTLINKAGSTSCWDCQ